MFYIIIASLLALTTIGLIFGWGSTKNVERGSYDIKIPGWSVGVGVAVLALFTAVMSVTTVDARAVGIQTAFGQYKDTLQSGFQLTAPWSSVEQFTTRLQLADLDGAEGVPVTFDGGGSGKVNANFQWAIDSSDGSTGAEALWRSYPNFEAVQAFVQRAGRDAILNVSNDYLPNDARRKQDEIAGKVKATLGATLSKYGIVLDSVSILGMPLDEKTQASLDKLVAAQNDEETAKSQNRRAQTDAATVKLREAAGALSPAANTRYCLEIANSWDVTKNGPLPATFNCGLGSTSPVLVGTK